MAIERGTDVEYIGSNASGGMVMGASSSELIGFYGKAPIARATMTAHNTNTTTGLTRTVRSITATLVNLGFIITA
jgi:hypothetical protein